VLVVCSGNICRSPMVAEYLRHRAARSGLDHIVVDSAGTLGIVGEPASIEAIEAMSEIGLDLRGHRSKGLAAVHLRAADRIIVMARNHLVALARLAPRRGERPLLLRAFERGTDPWPDAPDLDDPMGESIEVYRQQLAIMRRSVDHLVLHLKYLRTGHRLG
jgi:protein-tyrosine phosphatase